MRALALLLAALALPGAAVAATVTARTGDHDGFTLLVLTADEEIGWSLSGVGATRRVMFDRPVEIALDGAFDRIGRTRLAALAATSGDGLTLTLACRCAVTAMGLGPRALILDIGPAEPPVVAADAPPSPEDESLWQVENLERVTYDRDALAPLDPLPDFRPPPARLPLPIAPSPLDRALAAEGIAAPVEGEVMRGVGRAVEQEVLEGPAPVGPRVGLDSLSVPNIRIETSVDRDLSAIAPALSVLLRRCLTGARFDVADWGDEADPWGDFGRLRGALTTEADRPDPAAIEALARRYVWLTFGAEAEELLRLFPADTDAAKVLRVMAAVVDGAAPLDRAGAEALIRCRTDAALWAILATRERLEIGSALRDAAIADFSDLPLHLRRALGPVLVERLLDAGATDAARRAWRAVTRASGDHGTPFSFATSLLELREGFVGAATRRLEDVTETDPTLAPLALATLLEARLETGGAVDALTVEAARTLAFERRRDPEMAQRLRLAEMRVRLREGRARSVLDDLPEALDEGTLSDEAATRLMPEIHLAAAAGEDDATFLAMALNAPQGLAGQEGGPEALRAMGERLLSLGFPDEALAMMAAAPVEDRALTEATAALSAGRPAEAAALLEGRTDAPARRIVARALSAGGRHLEAADLFAALGDMDAARGERLRAAAWDGLADGSVDGEDDAVTEAARLADRPPLADPGDDDGYLVGKRALLDGAAETRARIAALLDALPPAVATE